MSLPIVIIIMLLAGITGGIINFLLPSNIGEDKLKIRSKSNCIALGIGATILIPLFLEIAQSKLMDHMHTGWRISVNKADSAAHAKDSLNISINLVNDTVQTTKKDSGKFASVKQKVKLATIEKANDKEEPFPEKNYFLFAAYCFLAAAAGYRFISSITDSVLKDKQIAEAKKGEAKAVNEKEKIKQEKEAVLKVKELREKNAQMSQATLAIKMRKKVQANNLENLESFELDTRTTKSNKSTATVIPSLPAITHPDDPQKGRFGGLPERNDRKLSAKVEHSSFPDFYKVSLTVESTDASNPLDADVIFYIHDSFNPSIFSYTPTEFTNGKAINDEILSYGAFTVGVITDNGNTLLELDLANDDHFPKDFRER